MHEFTNNQLLDFELAYKHNPDILQMIAEIRELRQQAEDDLGGTLCRVCGGDPDDD